MNRTLRYPDEAVNGNIMGTVVVVFDVDTTGAVSNVWTISGPTKGGLREESIRLVKVSGKWVPATLNGHPVNFTMQQPIVFKLAGR
jgi:protein TonB